MNVLLYISSVVLSFLGLFAGVLLSHYTPDESQDLKKYIPFIQLCCLVLVFVLIFVYFPFYVASALLILTFSFIYLFWKHVQLNILDYIVFSLLFVLTSLDQSAHLYMTTIIFVFGLFSGSLFYVLHTKSAKGKKSVKHQKESVAHHKHSGKQYSFSKILRMVFVRYYFVLLLSVGAFFIAELVRYILY